MKPLDRNLIQMYFHCSKCLDEIPKSKSPKNHARLNVGYTKKGIQVWCSRHDCNVVAFDFLGQKISFDDLRGEK